MRRCAESRLKLSLEALAKALPAGELRRWQALTKELCDSAYLPYSGGSIHSQLLTGCQDRLNNTLLREFRGLEASP